MKILVVTNCVTGAFVDALRALFPTADARGAMTPTARTWMTSEPNDLFKRFLASTNLLVTSAPDDPIFETLPESAIKVFVPHFSFWGLHPDSFDPYGPQPPSVLKGASLQSRIAMTAFLMGKPWQEAKAAFNSDVYERLGYFAIYDLGRRTVIEHFASVGIDLAGSFQRWEEAGDYLYTHNHPKMFVLHDLLRKALVGRVMSEDEAELARPRLLGLTDPLEVFAWWPVYPEIAARRNFATPFLWRTSRADGSEAIDLDEFLQRTYHHLESFDQLTQASIPGFELCAAALGG
jgi:hypothetical protein